MIKILQGFSYSTIFLAIITVAIMVIPCLIKMPEIAPLLTEDRVPGAYSYYPGTLYSDMKNCLLLLLPLAFFREVEDSSLFKRFSKKWSHGLILGVYLSFFYFSASSLRRGIFLFGFSFGPHGWTLIYYITGIFLIFKFLNKYVYTSVWKSLSASFFTVFMSSTLWELPHCFIWASIGLADWTTNHIIRTFGQVVTFSMVLPALHIFKVKLKSFNFFIPLFLALVVLDYFAGKPTPGVTAISPIFNIFCMISRITALLGLVYIFWIRGYQSSK